MVCTIRIALCLFDPFGAILDMSSETWNCGDAADQGRSSSVGAVSRYRFLVLLPKEFFYPHKVICSFYFLDKRDINLIITLIDYLTTTLTGLHFAATTLMTIILRWTGHIQSSHLPASEILKFVVCGNFSIVGMNVSLMWNTVGFYQIAKLSMIPVSCFLEVVLDKVRYSRDTKLSILLVLLGVAICTVPDMGVNAKGFIAAFVAVWAASLQQYGGRDPDFLCYQASFGVTNLFWLWVDSYLGIDP
ncbi:hypothetical protein RHGRI_038057 [Rhododendron griersonianum]|uniref:Sugar phosphate transporter domain-containing protein n=1 Tax=Rhododendron griersonianum TaxID=479676 RepID=A0AAV6HUV2_9ERIC|nr:hypothetical protein RHGRI_038057 [Rhododendron griersonianum]